MDYYFLFNKPLEARDSAPQPKGIFFCASHSLKPKDSSFCLIKSYTKSENTFISKAVNHKNVSNPY